jgi:hypothetical protein
LNEGDDMARTQQAGTSQAGTTSPVRIAVALAATAVGVFLLLGTTSAAASEGVFIGSIALVLAIYVWPGLTKAMARVVAVVLVLVGLYAFVRGFELMDLSVLRQIGGAVAILSGVILLLPLVRRRLGQDR